MPSPQDDYFALKKLREFTEKIARMTVPGEPMPDADGVEYPYSHDNCEEDATALYALIGEARMLVWGKEQR